MAPNTTRHMEPEEMERYSMGEGTEKETAKLEEHLLVCEMCRNRLAESDALVGAMQKAGRRLRQERDGRQRRRWSAGWLPMLAATAVVAGAILWGWNRLGAGPEFTVRLTAARGAGLPAQAPAGTPLALEPDLAGLPPSGSYALELLDAAGNRVWQGTFPGGPVPPQRAGTYHVRIYSSGGETLREYELAVK